MTDGKSIVQKIQFIILKANIEIKTAFKNKNRTVEIVKNTKKRLEKPVKRKNHLEKQPLKEPQGTHSNY